MSPPGRLENSYPPAWLYSSHALLAPEWPTYDLRHSHASLLIDIGAHPKAISERMGHTEIGVTMNVYGHLFEGKQRELTSDLNDLLHRTRSKKGPADGEATEPERNGNDAK